jgi:hypothetical protein
VGTLSWRNVTEDTDFAPFNNVSVTPAVTTVYVFKAENAPCLPPAYDTVTVTVIPLPEVYSINDTTICLGQDVLLTATGVGTLFWRNVTEDTEFVPFNSMSVTPAVTTVYVFKAENAPCLHLAYDTVTITVHAPPDLSVYTTDATICQTDSVALRATSNYDLQWYALLPSGEPEPVVEYTIAPEITTQYIAVASHAPCPPQSATITIVVLPVPEPVFLIEQADNDVTVQIPSTLEKGYKYIFDFGDRSQTVNQAEMAHQYLKRGTYYATLTIQKDNTSCARSFSREIRIDADAPGEFMLYPNPANHLINVIAPSEILYYRIIQAGRGEVVKEASLPGDETRIQITLQQLSVSIYILQIHTRSGWMSKTFVKSL